MTHEEFYATRVPDWSIPDKEKGVVSAADARFFLGLRLLYYSLRNRVQVTLFDLGLEPPQRAWCENQGVDLRPNPVSPDITVPTWQAWNKPYYIAASPYKYTLWLDSDTMVVDNLGPLFDAIGAGPGPLLLLHPAWADFQWYEPKLLTIFPLPKPASDNHRINNGVLGFKKGRDADASLLALWSFMVDRCIKDPEIRAMVHWWDEGCINWAIPAADLEWTITPARGWNKMIMQRGGACESEFFDLVRADAGDVILHFAGHPKLWQTWR